MARRHRRNPFYDNFSDFGFGAWYDQVLDVAKAVIPEKTIVGKAIRGDVTGAAQATVSYVSGPPRATSTPSRTTTLPSPADTGGLPSWAMPVGVVVGGVLLLSMMRR